MSCAMPQQDSPGLGFLPMAPGRSLSETETGLRSALHEAEGGELGQPRTAAELATAACELFGASADVDRTGSMAWLRAKR